MIEIPIKDLAAFTETIILDGDVYKFSFYWNTKGEYWSLSILDKNSVEIINDIKLVLEHNLFEHYPDIGLPDGKLFVIDTTNSYAPIGRDDFFNDRKLSIIYIEKNELL